MAKAPAFQFYAGDFLTGTTLMSNAEVGLFIRLLCLQAEHGSIPDDVERIVRAYGEEARTLWTGVQPKFIPGSTAGTLVNARLCEVLAARDAFRQRQSEKGKASAAVRSSGSTKKKVRFNRGSTVVEPLGDREGDEVLSQERKERAKVRDADWFKEQCRKAVEEQPDILAPSERKGFFDYWTEPSASGQLRFQDQKFFDFKRRMRTWQANANKSPQAKAETKPSPTAKSWMH